MREKIYTYLKSRNGGAASHELVEHVLKIKGASPGISETLIRTAVAGDRRFAVDEHHLWKIIEKGGTPLSEAEFVLLSLLTLDTVERSRTIVEVSAQKLRNDKIVDRLHICINPGSPVVPTLHLPPDFVQEIKGGISGGKAACSLSNFFGEAVLVGYDIQSTVDQLNKILNTVNKPIENSVLCLHDLTKKLIPSLHQKSLDDIASFLKLTTMDTRRTEKEIGVIADIFSRHRELLKEQGFSTVEEVLEFQYPDIEYVDFSKYAFDKCFLWAIPQKPGIYKMRDKHGEVIYIGKAKNLRARVSSYFWNTADRLQKITDLLRSVYSIEYEIAGSELSAMLMEYRLIKQHQPRLNQQLEVHERAARYERSKNFIVLLPSSAEESLELFFVREGLPLEQYEILKDAVNFSEVERMLDKVYYESIEASGSLPLQAQDNKTVPKSSINSAEFPTSKERLSGMARDSGRFKVTASSGENSVNDSTLTDVETGEMDIVLSWLEINKDHVNYINMDTVCTREACMKLVKDYIRDEETLQKKHFRLR